MNAVIKPGRMPTEGERAAFSRGFDLGRKAGAEEAREQILEALGIYDLVAKAIEQHEEDTNGD